MDTLRSIVLFALAAVAEIGGAWLVWQGVREHRGWIWIGAGVIALGLYGFVATLQPDANFGRILAAYGGVFVAGSLLWGMALDGFRPDRWDITGALICLVGVAVIMYAPRTAGEPSEGTDDLRRSTHSQHVGRDVGNHHGTSADHRVVADGDTRADDRSPTDPHVVTDGDR